jgi:hypothetical protein
MKRRGELEGRVILGSAQCPTFHHQCCGGSYHHYISSLSTFWSIESTDSPSRDAHFFATMIGTQIISLHHTHKQHKNGHPNGGLGEEEGKKEGDIFDDNTS